MSEPRNAIALDTPAPVDGKGVGETGCLSFTASDRKAGRRGVGRRTRSGFHRSADHLAADSGFRYLADALGLSGSDEPRGSRQLARVQVAALQTRPPRMQPSSLIVLVSCNVRLPE